MALCIDKIKKFASTRNGNGIKIYVTFKSGEAIAKTKSE